MPGLTADAIRDKDAAARQRECFDKVRTHIRAGSWTGRDGAEVRVVGSVWTMHGTVCTCCPKRAAQ